MIKAIIFDMDGVISDTQHFHSGMDEVVLKRYGIDKTAKELEETYAGVPVKEIYNIEFQKNNLPLNDIPGLFDERWKKIIEQAEGNIKAIQGAIQLISKLKNKGFKLAVASGSIRIFVEMVLRELNLTDEFDAVVTGDDVEKGKPNPDIFLLAASRLKVNPKECVVIEDGINGMIAAKKAGMKCIGLVENNKKKDYPADLVVGELENITMEVIAETE